MTALVARVVEGLPGGALTLFEVADVDAALERAIRTGARAPYGAVLWDAAPCVVAALASVQLRGARVIELGCGTGLVSLACARAGATVLATDVDELALEAARRGAAHASLRLACAVFDVGAEDALPDAELLVAADLMYEPPLARALARRVAEQLARGGKAVVGDPGRIGRADFEDELARRAQGLRPDFVAVVVGAHRADVAVVG